MGGESGDLKRFFKHSVIYAIGNIINRLGAFLLLPIYTNYLTTSQYGAVEMFYAISAVISGILSVGIAHATLRFYFEYADERDAHAVVSTNLIVSFCIVLFGVLPVAVWRDEIALFIFDNLIYRQAILIILGTMIFELSSQVCLAYIRAKEYSLFFVGISIIKLLIQVSLNIWLVVFQEAGVIGVLFGNFCTVLLAWLVLATFTIKECGFRFHPDKAKVVLIYSYPFLLSTLVGIVAANIDRFLINDLISLSALGLYALAFKFSLLIEVVVGEPFNRSYGSFRFSIMKQDNAAHLQSSITRYFVALLVMAGLGLSMFTKELLMIMSDASFHGAIDLLPLLVLAVIIKTMTYPFQTGILYKQKTGYVFYISLITGAVGISASLILINQWGVYGACWAQILMSVTGLLITHFISKRYFKVDYNFSRLLIIFIIGTGVFIASLMISTDSMLLSLLFKAVLMSACAFLIYFSPAFENRERKQILEFIDQKIFTILKFKA